MRTFKKKEKKGCRIHHPCVVYVCVVCESEREREKKTDVWYLTCVRVYRVTRGAEKSMAISIGEPVPVLPVPVWLVCVCCEW